MKYALCDAKVIRKRFTYYDGVNFFARILSDAKVVRQNLHMAGAGR